MIFGFPPLGHFDLDEFDAMGVFVAFMHSVLIFLLVVVEIGEEFLITSATLLHAVDFIFQFMELMLSVVVLFFVVVELVLPFLAFFGETSDLFVIRCIVIRKSLTLLL